MNKKIKIFGLILLLFCVLGYGFFSVLKNSREEKINELFSYAELARKAFKNKPDYWGLDSKLLIEKNLINKSKEGKIINSFGKEVTIGNDFEGYKIMPGSKTFDVAYLGLDHKACVDLITYELQDKQKLSLISVKIRAEGKTTEFGWGGENKLPISTNSAKKVCNIEGNVDILWTFE